MSRYVYARQQPQVALTNYGHQVAHYTGQSHLHGQPQAQVYCEPAIPGQPQRATIVQAATLEIPPCPQPDPITLQVQPTACPQQQPRLVSADTAMMQHPRQVSCGVPAYTSCGPVVGAVQQPNGQIYHPGVYQSGPAVFPSAGYVHSKVNSHIYM